MFLCDCGKIMLLTWTEEDVIFLGTILQYVHVKLKRTKRVVVRSMNLDFVIWFLQLTTQKGYQIFVVLFAIIIREFLKRYGLLVFILICIIVFL